MESLKILRNDFHAQVLRYRKLDYVVRSESFEIAFREATPEEKRGIYLALMQGNKLALEQFIEKQFCKLTPFEQMSTRKLRTIGQHLGIMDYQYLNKVTLIEEINRAVQRVKENSERVTHQSQSERPGGDAVHLGNKQPTVLAY